MDRKQRVLIAVMIMIVTFCLPEAVRLIAERMLEVIMIVHLSFEAFKR